MSRNGEFGDDGPIDTRSASPDRHEDSLSTLLLQDDGHDAFRQPIHGAAPALYQTSLFTFGSFEEMRQAIESKDDAYIYTRGRNPTVRAFEEKIALLEGAQDACAFASGMGAIAAVVLGNVRAGDKILCIRNVYPDAYKLMTRFLPKFGVETEFVDGTSSQAVQDRLDDDQIKLLYLESPTTLLFELQDLEALCRAARQRGVVTVVDNSWATPLGQRPLDHGADLVLHSASKYLSGHSDVVAGVVAGSSEAIGRLRDLELMVLGGKLSPFDAWLLLRGLRTLPLRLERHESSARKIADFLAQQAQITKVHYPGDAGHPQGDLYHKYFSCGGGLLSFELADEAQVEPFVDALRVFSLGVSWGGFESLVYPVLMSHLTAGEHSASRAFGVPRSLVRLHVGLEDPADLITDLARALGAVETNATKGEKAMEV
ncbi:MAG: PLP-dependent aspartate aminotransferase family protein [Trueperaceae bacterium]